MPKSHAVYVGSFDPMSLGHLDIVERGTKMFERITIGIGLNPDKQPLFSAEERVQLCEAATAELPNVEVKAFNGLAVEFVRQCGSRVLLRGVRSLTDIDSEFTMSLANRVLDDDIESVFLMSSERYNHISSSLVKQIARMSGKTARERLSDFLPEPIIAPLMQRISDLT